MKTRLFLCFLLSIIPWHGTPSQAANVTIKIGSSFSATFSPTLKFAGKDCVNFKFSWKASTSLNYPHHIIFVYVENQKKESIGEQIELKPGDAYGLEQGSGKWSGKESLELCQSTKSVLEDEDCDTTTEDCEYVDVGGILPGKYYVSANLTQIRPKFAMKDSNKVTLTISK
jgi:hypothetical protein